MIEFADVTVRRGSATLLDKISWRVAEGERWVVLGPNGAGKTTLLQVASAQIHPTDGVAAIPTTGFCSWMLPVEPRKRASPKAKMPPSEATSQ